MGGRPPCGDLRGPSSRSSHLHRKHPCLGGGGHCEQQAASQEHRQGRQGLRLAGQRDLSQGPFSPAARSGWPCWMPSPIQGEIAQHDRLHWAPGLRAQGVLSGAGRGAKRGQTLPEERPRGTGGDGAGAKRPKPCADTWVPASPGPCWQDGAGLLAAREAAARGVSRLGSDRCRAPWGAGWGPGQGRSAWFSGISAWAAPVQSDAVCLYLDLCEVVNRAVITPCLRCCANSRSGPTRARPRSLEDPQPSPH